MDRHRPVPGPRAPAAAWWSRTVRSTAALVLGALLLTACTARPLDPGGGDPGPAPAASGATSAPTEPTRRTAPPEPAPPSTEPLRPEPTRPPPSAPQPTGTAVPEPTPEAPHAWRAGDEGPEVLALQERLIALGYFLPAADGDFGPATQQAVWALQKAAGLERDGLVGPLTQAALDAGVRPGAQSSTGRVLEVDLTRQLVLAVDDGVVVRAINASTGNGETYVALGRTYLAYTPTGDWVVERQIDALHESGLELGPMYRPKYFHRGWAVHGSPSVPPWPASHGCVRVSNAAMNWIWDAWGAPLGTRVLIY